jgi:hypothetical protein
VALALPVFADAAELSWQPWTDDLFARAKSEHRLVLLDLEAVWCHWCHVMDETTYRDPAVVALLRDHYLIVRVDQDSRPDLSNRYEDYGWPATIVFDADGKELVKRSGYLPPPLMGSLLQAIIDDPTPGPSVHAVAALQPAVEGTLGAEQRTRLQEAFRDSYDHQQAAWGGRHKYLDADCVEYSLLLMGRGQTGGDASVVSGPEAASMAEASLSAARALFDPVWGGVYQYSTGGVWTEPHFEKIMAYQADYLRSYALAYAATGHSDDLHACQEVRRFLTGILTSPSGAFYASQDADVVPGEHSADYFARDDAGRRALGIPRIDTHLYARENGWAITALAALAGASGDTTVLDQAVRAARWVVANRALSGGGFSHDAADAGGPFLGDTLAMARAGLALYAVTGERAWLTMAQAGLDFIAAHFTAPATCVGGEPAGYLTTAAIPGGLPPTPQRDENIALARLANLMFRYTGSQADHAMAVQAFRYVAAPGVADRRPTAGVLIADSELASAPLHLTVVGAKDDERAAALFRAAAADACVYKRLDWYDAREGPLPGDTRQLPSAGVPALYLCVDGRCSKPVTAPDLVRAAIDRSLGRAPHAP